MCTPVQIDVHLKLVNVCLECTRPWVLFPDIAINITETLLVGLTAVPESLL